MNTDKIKDVLAGARRNKIKNILLATLVEAALGLGYLRHFCNQHSDYDGMLIAYALGVAVIFGAVFYSAATIGAKQLRKFIYLFSALSFLGWVCSIDIYRFPLIWLKIPAFALFIYGALNFKIEWGKWGFGLLALVYNPIIQIRLAEKSTYGGNENIEAFFWLNHAVFVFLWAALYFENKNNKT